MPQALPLAYRFNPNAPLTLAGLTLTTLLTGCISMSGIAPQTEIKAPETLAPGKAINGAARIEWPHDQWWQAYHDAQLDRLVEQALTGSPTLRVAQARVRLAQSFADRQHAATRPSVGGDASIVRERFTALQFIPPPWGGSVDWNNRVAATLAYDLDLWGQQESLWRSSVDEVSAASAEARQVKLELETAIVRSYVQLALAHTLRDLAEAHMEEIEHRIAIARRALAAGLGTQLELSEAETPHAPAHAQIAEFDVRIGLLRNQLAALTGQGPGAGDGITRPDLKLDAAFGLPDQLPANLVGRRPDVLAARWRIEAAQQGITSAKAAFYPNINLLAFIGLQALGFGQLISSAANIAGVGPAMSLPIFDGGRRRGNLAGSTAGYDIAVESYNGVLVKALQDVSDQLVILQANAGQRRDAEQALATARKAHTLAEASYHAGLSNYQQVLVTHTAVLQQQALAAQYQAVRLDAHAGLMRALGGGVMEDVAQAHEATR